MDEWSKSQNISLEQTDWTEPQPPPQAQTEQVNVVFTGSGKSDDSLKTQKDPPPPIVVDNKTEKDKPIKTSKGLSHVPTGRYVVPTGRVIATVSIKVPTSRYIVPAGYIISPGLKDLSRAETYKWYQSLERVSVEE
ncbi:hypothetical protein Tco_0779457 [Tanacetum coccineum]